MAAATGAKSSIGASAVQLRATALMVTFGVSVKAAAANNGTVYVGIDSGVTAGTADATDGYELAAGNEVFVPAAMINNDASKVYLIGSATGQKVFYIAV